MGRGLLGVVLKRLSVHTHFSRGNRETAHSRRQQWNAAQLKWA
jgi:hypothetical protein